MHSYSSLIVNYVWNRTHRPASSDNIGISASALFPGDFHPLSPWPLSSAPKTFNRGDTLIGSPLLYLIWLLLYPVKGKWRKRKSHPFKRRWADFPDSGRGLENGVWRIVTQLPKAGKGQIPQASSSAAVPRPLPSLWRTHSLYEKVVLCLLWGQGVGEGKERKRERKERGKEGTGRKGWEEKRRLTQSEQKER